MIRMLLFLLLAATTALADIVTLKDGTRLEGRLVSEQGDVVVIRTPQGTRRIPRDRVEQIRKSKSVYDTLDAELAKVKEGDVKGLLKAANWANSNRLYPEAQSLYQKVLELEPANAAAKKAVASFETMPVGSGGSGAGPGGNDRRVSVRGKDRVYTLYVPRSYSGQPTPCLIWLHADGSGRGSYMGTLVPLADKYGFIIISGEGGGTWRGWQQGKGSEDDEYLLRAFEEVKRLANVDLTRVYVAGHSRGGTYSSRFGADYTDLLAAAGMHNGVWVADGRSGRKTPFFIYTGENDYLAKEYGFAWDHAEKLGHEVKRHEGKGAGHEPRADAFDAMFQWFATKRLPKSALWE